MTPEEFATQMRKISNHYYDDLEVRHGRADDLLCGVLRKLGYEEGIDIYEKMDKWYA